MKRLVPRRLRLPAGQRGQSVAEYSLTTFLLFMIGPGSILVIWPKFVEAYAAYVGGFYWLLNMPIP